MNVAMGRRLEAAACDEVAGRRFRAAEPPRSTILGTHEPVCSPAVQLDAIAWNPAGDGRPLADEIPRCDRDPRRRAGRGSARRARAARWRPRRRQTAARPVRRRDIRASTSTPFAAAFAIVVSTATGSLSTAITGPYPSARRRSRARPTRTRHRAASHAQSSASSSTQRRVVDGSRCRTRGPGRSRRRAAGIGILPGRADPQATDQHRAVEGTPRVLPPGSTGDTPHPERGADGSTAPSPTYTASSSPPSSSAPRCPRATSSSATARALSPADAGTRTVTRTSGRSSERERVAPCHVRRRAPRRARRR